MENLDFITLAIPIFFLLIVAEILFDALRRGNAYRLNDGISNLSAGTFQQLYGFVPKAISAFVFTITYQGVGLFKETLTYDKIWVWVLLFVLVDFIYYWFHRASHRIALFWSGHVVHHQSEEYNLTVALRQSWVQGIFSAPLIAIYGLLGFDFLVVVAVGSLNTISQFWIHTRYIKKLPSFLEAFLNTPSHHRVHHGRNLQYIDKNYAGAFIIWDKIFGTFEPEVEELVYGITVPTKTWNPFYDQFSNLRDLIQLAVSRSLVSGLRTFIKPPGWDPKQEENLKFVGRAKFNPKVSNSTKILAACLYLATVGLASFYLFQIEILAFEAKAGLIILSSVMLLSVGRLLDGSKKA